MKLNYKLILIFLYYILNYVILSKNIFVKKYENKEINTITSNKDSVVIPLNNNTAITIQLNSDISNSKSINNSTSNDIQIDRNTNKQIQKNNYTNKNFVKIWLPSNSSPYLVDNWCWSCFDSIVSSDDWGYWIDNNFYLNNNYINSFITFLHDIYFDSDLEWYNSVFDESIIDFMEDDKVLTKTKEENNIDSNIVKYDQSDNRYNKIKSMLDNGSADKNDESNIVKYSKTRKTTSNYNSFKDNKVINNKIKFSNVIKFTDNLNLIDETTKKDMATKELKFLKTIFFNNSNYNLKDLKNESKKYVFSFDWIQRQMIINYLARLEHKLKTLKSIK